MTLLQENDEVDQRLSSIRDTSFSWESIDSQVGSRQSLLDNKGRSRVVLCSRDSSAHTTLAAPGAWPGGGAGGAGGGGGGGGHPAGDEPAEMDLTRRQRDQRKKDIREKVDKHSQSSSCSENKVYPTHK